MISKLTVQNFKNLRQLAVDLEPLTVFVGSNGSGKTSVLQAAHYAWLAATSEPQKVFVGNRHGDWLYTRGGQGDLLIDCDTDRGCFEVKVSPPANFPLPSDRPGRADWKVEVDFYGSTKQEFLGRGRSLVSLRLDPAKLARPSYSDSNPPRLESSGRNLPSVLAYMALNDPDAFNELLLRMRELIRPLKRVRFTKAPVTRLEREYIRAGSEPFERRINRVFQGDAMLFDFEHADNLPAHAVSEGTLMLLGLLTALMGPSHPEILLMEDIERGLHPLAQKTLIGSVETLVNDMPLAQVIATAHSPYLLDYLTPDQVRLMAIGDDGYAVAGRLDDHPEFKRWKDEMAPGELWSLFGDKWVARKEAAQ